jgi:hypothetical protein
MMTLHKCFSHPSLVIYFFSTPTVKLKLGMQLGGRSLLTATHLDQSNYLTNQQQVLGLLCLLHSFQNKGNLRQNILFSENCVGFWQDFAPQNKKNSGYHIEHRMLIISLFAASGAGLKS